MTFQDFVNTYQGRTDVGDNVANTGQCTGVVNVWFDTIGTPHVYGNACDMPSYADKNAYDIIPNSPTFVPQVGDAVCWPAGWGGSAVGHTALVAPGTTVNKLVVFEQNDRIGGGNGACRLYSFDYSSNPVFIHPKIKGDQPVANAIDVLRIVAGEVEGYGLDGVYDGKYDAQLQASWGSRPIEDFIRHGYNDIAAPNHTLKVQLHQQITDLQNQVADHQNQIDALTKQVADLQKQSPAVPGAGEIPDLSHFTVGELFKAALSKLFNLK